MDVWAVLIISVLFAAVLYLIIQLELETRRMREEAQKHRDDIAKIIREMKGE